MKGWLIYDSEGRERNGWFIQRLLTLAKEKGLDLELKTDIEGDAPDFAIVRAIHPNYNKALEEKGVRVFNNFLTSKTACDKWETYLLCKELNIPVLRTWKKEKPPLYPCVMKSVDGHGGTEVFWLKSEEDFKKAKSSIKGAYIFQEPSYIVGKDMRAYALGDEIVACVMRQSDKDFKSNFSLGGKVSLTSADEMQKEIVKKLREKLKFDYVGIDFMPTKSGWVLNEIEDSAGSRMLYSLSDFDVAERYIDYIKSVL